VSDWNENPRKIVTKHPDCVEVGECRPRHQGSKNTRHWCKGRVGIPHTWEWRRERSDVEREQRMGLTYNRITEVPVCFGCDKVDRRYRHYCGQCGEPWPELQNTRTRYGTMRRVGWKPCVRCGAPWLVRHREGGGAYVASGSVLR
jgi:hypothetical protein